MVTLGVAMASCYVLSKSGCVHLRNLFVDGFVSICFPSTLNKLEVIFGIHYSVCSHIVKQGVNLLAAKFENRLIDFDFELVIQRLEEYQTAIERKSKGAATTCFALIDATLHQICRPWDGGRRRHTIRNQNNIQQAAYSGHKRHHGLKFQSVIVPDGMIVEMFGPVEGRRHDTTVLKSSNLEQQLLRLPPRDLGCCPPYRDANKPMHMRAWNRKLRTVRISVEHG